MPPSCAPAANASFFCSAEACYRLVTQPATFVDAVAACTVLIQSSTLLLATTAVEQLRVEHVSCPSSAAPPAGPARNCLLKGLLRDGSLYRWPSNMLLCKRRLYWAVLPPGWLTTAAPLPSIRLQYFRTKGPLPSYWIGISRLDSTNISLPDQAFEPFLLQDGGYVPPAVSIGDSEPYSHWAWPAPQAAETRGADCVVADMQLAFDKWVVPSSDGVLNRSHKKTNDGLAAARVSRACTSKGCLGPHLPQVPGTHQRPAGRRQRELLRGHQLAVRR
jgi:hypothetical protein